MDRQMWVVFKRGTSILKINPLGYNLFNYFFMYGTVFTVIFY